LDEAEFAQNLFHIPAHQIIFVHLVGCYTDSGTTDWQLFRHSFRLKELADIGGIDYLSAIYGELNSAANWKHYYGILRQMHIRRTTILAAEALKAKMLEDSFESEAEVREIAEKALTSIAVRNGTKSEVWLSKLIREDHTGTKLNGCSSYIEATAIRALNLAMGGLIPGEQVVIAAETSYGKTTLALNMALHAALGPQKKKVAIFSFEMSSSDICKRLTASGAAVPLRALRYNETTPEQEAKVENFYDTIPENRTIVIEEGYSFDITEVVSRCRRLKATGELDIVIVDYLQLVNPAITREINRQREVADISRRLKVMAGELKVVVIALSQLNESGRLRESRAIGQDADIVLFIEDSKSEDSMEKQIRIGKARNGPRDQKVPVSFYGDYVTFSDKS
jgi:replicative DNA helicase